MATEATTRQIDAEYPTVQIDRSVFQGNLAMAIVCYKNKSALRMGIGYHDIMERINDDKELFGGDYRVLAIYSNVNVDACKVIERAEYALRHGMQIDLEKLLWQ